MLKPNYTYSANGVEVKSKIIPDGSVWKDDAKAKKAGFRRGALYKKQKKLNHNTGKPLFITIHNTAGHNNINDEGELYTRATYNENMGSARVHFYVDALGAWQNLKAGTGKTPDDPTGSAEVSWHAGDGAAQDGGNYTSISMEVIMGKKDDALNKKAYDNAARLTAYLLGLHSLTAEDVVSHTYWVNKKANKIFSDRDEQSCNIIYGKKWCPVYIFASNNKNTALKNWKRFKEAVKSYMEKPEPTGGIKVGDTVEFSGDTHYTNANAEKGKKCKPGKAKVTLAVKGKHPYHLVGISSDVYGFVDAETVSKE